MGGCALASLRCSSSSGVLTGVSMSRENGADRLVPLPSQGRIFTTSRRVRLGDVRPSGELRLDGIARYLQDVSNDDSTDAGLTDDSGWVVRRTVVEVHRPATYREMLSLTTFCSGIGGRWAERRVSLSGDAGASIEAATLWVHIDPTTGRPRALPEQFHDLYDTTVGGRKVSASLLHDTHPPVVASSWQWPIRLTDLDPNGHVNNAASWEVVEEALTRWPGSSGPLRAELEYRDPILPDSQVTVVADWTAGPLRVWALDASGSEQRVFLTGVLTPI